MKQKNLKLNLLIQEVLPFYDDPTLQEAGTILFCLFILIVFLRVFRVVRAFPSRRNPWNTATDLHRTSPFLLEEQAGGEIVFSDKKYTLHQRLFAVVGVILIVLIPLSATESLQQSIWLFFH